MLQGAKKAVRAVFVHGWERKWTLFFVGLLMWQYVEWLAEYWLKETELIVKWVLLLVFFIEFFRIRPLVLRLALEIAAVVSVLVAVLGFPEKKVGALSDEEMLAAVAAVADHFSPFLWFALGAWVIYLYYSWWLTKKWRTAAFFFVSIFLFAVVDSFSPYILWDQVAVSVVSGLSLMVVHHFAHLKRAYPESWEQLRRSTVFVLFPFFAIVICCTLAAAAAWDIRPMLTDPYTAWKHWRGEEVRLPGKGLGAEPVLGPLSSLSGYSRDDRVLGGEFLFDYSPVMEITSSHRSYWRGETRTFYNGKGWESDEEVPRRLEPIGGNGELSASPGFSAAELETVEVQQQVKVLSDTRYPVLFGAFAPVKLERMFREGRPVAEENVRWNPDESVLLYNPSRRVAYPDTYWLVSEIPVIDEEKLRQAKREKAYEGTMLRYLQLPPDLPERVRSLALDVTRNETNDYDKVKKIEEYLSVTYRYTNQPDMSKARSSDFVDQFLFEVEEGYCDYFSTAMVIMTRTLGIPARWVKGYAPGTADAAQNYGPSPPENGADAGGTFIVTNADAHSWAEVYFEGYGWVPFEPTPGFVMPRMQPENMPEETSVLPENAPESADESPLPVRQGAQAAVLAALSGIAFFLVILAMRRRGALGKFSALFSRSSLTANEQAVWETEKLLRRLRRRGLKKYDYETLREAVRRWNEHDGTLGEKFEPILTVFEKAKYSGKELHPEELRRLREQVKHLRKEL